MALGEMGMFLPAESAYGTPGAFSQALRAEATKRASYLSEMDQFYAGLEESKKQFEETMTFREESWEDEMGLRRGELDLQRRMGIADLFVRMYQAKTGRIAARGASPGVHLGREKEDKKLEFLKDVWEEQRRGSGDGESGWLGPGFSYPSTGRAGMWD